MKSSKTTSLDIAEKAGVSQSTVSRALRNSPQVNEATRLQIQQIAKELGYTVDRNASRLRAKTTNTLALLVSEDDENTHINPFFLSLLSSISLAAARHGYDLLVTFQELSENWVGDFQLANRADGLVLMGIRDREVYDSQLAELSENGTPFVIWGFDEHHEPGVSSYISVNNKESARELTEVLITSGRKDFAFIGNTSAANPEFSSRHEGFIEALNANRISFNTDLHVKANSSEQEGFDAITALMDSGSPMDAIVCASDLIAIGALAALEDKNVRVPEDIAIVGYDDLPISQYTRPRLTTVNQDTELAGRLLVEHLIALVRGEPVSPQELPVNLVIRDSCGSSR